MRTDRTFIRTAAGTFLVVVLPLVVIAQSYTDPNPAVQWYKWNEGIAAVQSTGKFLVVDVYTAWCGWCKKMDETSYADPAVQQLLASSYISVKLDGESQDPVLNGTSTFTEQQWAKQLGVDGYPTVLLYDSQFRQVMKFSGYRDAKEFALVLKFVRDKQYARYSFQEYRRRHSGD